MEVYKQKNMVIYKNKTALLFWNIFLGGETTSSVY